MRAKPMVTKSIRFEPDVHAQLEELAIKLGVSVQAIVTAAVVKYLERGRKMK